MLNIQFSPAGGMNNVEYNHFIVFAVIKILAIHTKIVSLIF